MNNNFNKKGIYFMPLGGADEIGINLYVYAVNGKLIVVDAGHGFVNDCPGIELSLADVSSLEPYKNDIEGLFITHAHEDHFGAIAYIWPKLGCPVYATDFAMGLVKKRLKEQKIKADDMLHSVKGGDTVKLPNFSVQFASVVHSVPETSALIIRTCFGNVVHATDWRFDDNDAEFLHTNYQALEKVAGEGVNLFVCDSTNILNDKKEVSETEVRKNLLELVPQFKKGLVATCFASNIYRLESLILAAEKAGRTPVVAGRSLLQNLTVAKDCGYLKDLPKYYDTKEAKDIPSENALYICAGSQGDERSALYGISRGENKNVKLSQGDSIIFSSKIIPGNEEKIKELQEKFWAQDINVITEKDAPVHTSGHPGKEDLCKMYALLKPQIVLPVHGDKRFIREHKKFALSCGINTVGIVHNGDVMLICGGELKKIGEMPADVIGVDKNILLPLNCELLQERRKIALNGSVFVSMVFDEEWRVVGVKISSRDLMEKGTFEPFRDELEKELEGELENEAKTLGHDERKVIRFVRDEVTRRIRDVTGKEPITAIHFYKL